tara:strand:+ start:802 stop:1086 length:285 start_codon:yes stop_codon:yes gene_type:complete
MKKRELNISDKPLYLNTKEDIIFKAPLRIPSKNLQELHNLKNVNLSHYAFYDIAETEEQTIKHMHYRDNKVMQIFNFNFESPAELEMKMGDINT